jgi:hypothetical protein
MDQTANMERSLAATDLCTLPCSETEQAADHKQEQQKATKDQKTIGTETGFLFISVNHRSFRQDRKTISRPAV